jgi:hypothetical protein
VRLPKKGKVGRQGARAFALPDALTPATKWAGKSGAGYVSIQRGTPQLHAPGKCRRSTTQEFLSQTRPLSSPISVAQPNYGFPHMGRPDK